LSAQVSTWWEGSDDLVPALLHEGDQLSRGGPAMGRAQGWPLRQLAVLVAQSMQHLLHDTLPFRNTGRPSSVLPPKEAVFMIAKSINFLLFHFHSQAKRRQQAMTNCGVSPVGLIAKMRGAQASCHQLHMLHVTQAL